MKTRAFPKYFVHNCICKRFFASNFPHAPLNLISLTIFYICKTCFTPKIEQLSWKKLLNLTYLITIFLAFSLRSKLGIEKLNSSRNTNFFGAVSKNSKEKKKNL